MWSVLRLQDQVLPRTESVAGMIGHINFDAKITGKRSAGNPHATFDEAGDGNVAISANAPLLDPTCGGGTAVMAFSTLEASKIVALLLMYSIISFFIMNLTYMARINPDVSCSILFDEDEWKVLYCAGNRTKIPPNEPYSIKDAVSYLGHLGAPKRAPSDGPPGLKTIWIGLSNLHLLLSYREILCV